MTTADRTILNTIDTADYIKGELSDEEIEVPGNMIPPNPDESDDLPSHTHPSYPYGNPFHPKHPSARPWHPSDPKSRALFEDMGVDGGGINGTLRWKDLALNDLLPVDEAKEEAKRAMQARKMASGVSSHNPQTGPPNIPAAPGGQGQWNEGGDSSEDDEDDEEEGTTETGSEEVEEEGEEEGEEDEEMESGAEEEGEEESD